jgi:hypothetical protein
MLAWFRDLTARERSTMFACFGGWSLEAAPALLGNGSG